MLRRVPLKDGKPLTADSLNFQTSLFTPFKTPTPAIKIDRALPPRKRKRVSYKENGDDEDDDSDSGRKKKRTKSYGDVAYDSDGGVVPVKKFPVFKATPLEHTAKRRFSVPVMLNKSGEVVPTVMSRASLGIRPPIRVIPRPLHDPMADHAIVLYDPTVDDRETDEERREREARETKAAALTAAAAGFAGMANPHKSLKELLGETVDQTKERKVPVVIDPRLSKVLRPHQIEGVKVRSGKAVHQAWY